MFDLFPYCMQTIQKMIPKSFSLNSTSINTLFFHNNISSSKPANLSAFRNPHLKQTRLVASRGWHWHGGDDRAMETVLKLYEAIKNKNLHEMSEIIGHDCLCVCRFQTFSGKKQVMEFLCCLGNKLEFVVQPTLHHGMTVGVSWKLECSKTHKPLGKGFSFHMCHVYEGKVVIRNVEMILEPLMHIEPLALKMVAIMKGQRVILKKKAAAYALCCLLALGMLYVLVMAL